MTETYNGWTNYETWAVNLWIENEEPSYRHWRAETLEAWHNAEATKYQTVSEVARWALADNLKDTLEEFAPPLDGLYSDLLSAALGEVDYLEIADAWLQGADLDGYEPAGKGEAS